MGLHDGRVYWVTGAASGIGRATVEELAAEGAAVVASDLARADLSWAAARDEITVVEADATSEADNDAAAAAAVERYGRLDGALLNAGMPKSGPLTELPMAEFDAVMELNVRGVVLGLRAAVPHLGPGASLVAVASTSGIGADANMWPYNTSKGAVINLVRATAIDLGARGIRVNAVCPGPTETGMTMGIKAAPAVYEGLRRRIPLGRWGTAAEQAAVVSFLLSAKASFVNGAVVPVDGGVTANTSQFDPPERAY
jgi:NAD(P)-dependent dehydrogenase (short-subunit alcohol dehydrogenase family)